MNSFKFIAMMIAAGMTMVSAASAQSIPGTFVGANTVNTVRQDTGGEFSNENGLIPGDSNFWFDRSGNLPGNGLFAFNGTGNSGSVTTSGGFQGQFNDYGVVTTVTDLEPGDYEVRGIFSLVFGHTEIQYAVGLVEGDTSQVPDANPASITGGLIERYLDVGHADMGTIISQMLLV